MMLFSSAQLGILCFSKLCLMNEKHETWMGQDHFQRWISHRSSDQNTWYRKLPGKPSQLGNHLLAKNLEEFNSSSAQWRRIGRRSQRERWMITLWKRHFSKFHYKIFNFSSGIYGILKSKWSKGFVKIFHKSLRSCFKFPFHWTHFLLTVSVPSNPLHCFVSSLP